MPPTNESESALELLTRLRHGSHGAFQALFEKYRHHLAILALHKLGWHVRGKIDPEDIVDSALGSFFRQVKEGNLDFESWNELWSLLTLLVVRKCRHYARRYLGPSRDARKEVPYDEASTAGLPLYLVHAVQGAPTALEIVAMEELIQLMLQRLSERERERVKLFLQGFDTREIADHLGCSQRTVQLAIQRARAILAELDS